jgi:hypothetical protein
MRGELSGGLRTVVERVAAGSPETLVTAASRAYSPAARADRTPAITGEYVKRSFSQPQPSPENAPTLLRAAPAGTPPANAVDYIQRLEAEYGVVPAMGVGQGAAVGATPPEGRTMASQSPASPQSATLPQGIDMEELQEQVWRSVMDRLALEQERRGFSPWL